MLATTIITIITITTMIMMTMTVVVAPHHHIRGGAAGTVPHASKRAVATRARHVAALSAGVSSAGQREATHALALWRASSAAKATIGAQVAQPVRQSVRK